MSNEKLVDTAREYAMLKHNAAGCEYDGGNYVVHLDMVANMVEEFKGVFKNNIDYINTFAAAFCHDLIEDAQQSYNDVVVATNNHVGDITLAVTDVHAKNRLLRFLNTIPKTLEDHRALVLKLCDIASNSSYSKEHGSSMYLKYKKEWEFKKHIFSNAFQWHQNKLNHGRFVELINYINEIFE